MLYLAEVVLMLPGWASKQQQTVRLNARERPWQKITARCRWVKVKLYIITLLSTVLCFCRTKEDCWSVGLMQLKFYLLWKLPFILFCSVLCRAERFLDNVALQICTLARFRFEIRHAAWVIRRICKSYINMNCWGLQLFSLNTTSESSWNHVGLMHSALWKIESALLV